VIEIPQLVWQPILRGIVLRTRPKKSAHAYSQVWTPAGSPLAAVTAAQAKALQGAFGEGVAVDYAMRYGNPAIGDRVRALKEAGCTRILLAPLYPQYCAATTATANDEAFRALAAMRWQPAVRTLPPYFDDPRYIHALKTSIERQLAQADFEPDAIMASFHGMPERTLQLGDPYHCHCRKTGRLLGEALKETLAGRELIVTFQSRSGGPSGWSLIPTRRWASCRGGASRNWRWWRPVSRPTAWRRWRSWRSAARKASWPRAASISAIWPASTTAEPGSTCCVRSCAPNLKDGCHRHRAAANNKGEEHGSSCDRDGRYPWHRRGDQPGAARGRNDRCRQLCRQ
jgi:hypothetical protein